MFSDDRDSGKSGILVVSMNPRCKESARWPEYPGCLGYLRCPDVQDVLDILDIREARTVRNVQDFEDVWDIRNI